MRDEIQGGGPLFHMSQLRRLSVYDQLRSRLDASDLIERLALLGLKEVRRIGSESYCSPLCHESVSGESLQINLHTGRWLCRACSHLGMRGDLIQLIEYVQTGGRAPTHGEAQKACAEHQVAVQWACDQLGVVFDQQRMSIPPGLGALHMFAMQAHDYLVSSAPQVLDWIAEQWGFDRGVVDSYSLGFMPSPLLPAIVKESERAQSRDEFRRSGLGWYSPDGKWHTRFEGRVLFPYLEFGRAVYLIGRATPWTPKPDAGAHQPKYHKLSVHSETRKYISERITNDHLFNEMVMASADVLVVAEGVADAVALSSLGVPVVSPVTISFNATDLERFVRKAWEARIRRVEILFDNELSGSGNWAARRVGLQLVEQGLVSSVLTLPLGASQQAARAEVVKILGQEVFDELERSDPRERKEIVSRIADAGQQLWVQQQIEASKIDAAEWVAEMGASAAGKFDAIRREGKDVVQMEIDDVAKNMPPDDPNEIERASLFSSVIGLVAHIEERLSRERYAGCIAEAAGPGVTKAEIARRISEYRREVILPKKKEEKQKAKADPEEIAKSLVLLPPEGAHAAAKKPLPPPLPRNKSAAPPPPPPPSALEQTPHERYAPARDNVARAVEAKASNEQIGDYVAQTIMVSMGFTPFRTPDELYLVRGSERVQVGLGTKMTPVFLNLLWLASGLTPRKSAHGGYIGAVLYFLCLGARKTDDVSWSFVENGAVFFPTGDAAGRILKIEAGKVTRTKMAEVRVPAVAGHEFKPFEYVECDGGIDRALDVFRWTSLSEGDRMVLVYWLVCLPILRRVSTIPIVRIEGGSSSGKTRTVDAVSHLVNGRKSSSVPTAAALVSRMSTEMLTIDDNRESGDVSPAFLGTLLQATHLGAREKRKANSDTGTVVERVCGALMMNGIEPIHDGRSELASRILTLHCSEDFRGPDSPAAEKELTDRLHACRDAFWSASIRRCAMAMWLDQTYGESLGSQIEILFDATRIGRLSSYLRMMYLAWVAGLSRDNMGEHLAALAPVWQAAFSAIASGALSSLLAEELAVTAVRYVFEYGAQVAEGSSLFPADQRRAFGGKFVIDSRGNQHLEWVRATQLARFARAAGKELNAPRAVSLDLRAGQLEQRLLDGLAFLAAAGFAVEVTTTAAGRHRFAFARWAEREGPEGGGSGGGGSDGLADPSPRPA